MSNDHTHSEDAGDHCDAEIKYPSAGPRITPEAIEGQIISEHYFTAYEGATGAGPTRVYPLMDFPEELKLLTFCVLVLKNGFMVVGTSACASPSNFSKDIGQRVARQDAVNQIWPLLGYELRSRLHYAETVGDEDLGDALTHLLAHSLGNVTVLTPTMASKIVGKFEVDEPEEDPKANFKQQLEK